MTATHQVVHTIAIIGIDGAGKTTQARLLAAWLTAQGFAALYRPNPGGRRWFGRLANRLGRPDAQALLGTTGLLVVETVLRWAGIARAALVTRLRRRIAVMDRYSWCQYASIRTHLGRTRTAGERVARWLFGLLPPADLTVFLASRPAAAYARIEARGTDHEELRYLIAADAAYRSLPESPGFVVIDADRPADLVQRDLRAAVGARLRPAETLKPQAGMSTYGA